MEALWSQFEGVMAQPEGDEDRKDRGEEGEEGEDGEGEGEGDVEGVGEDGEGHGEESQATGGKRASERGR